MLCCKSLRSKANSLYHWIRYFHQLLFFITQIGETTNDVCQSYLVKISSVLLINSPRVVRTDQSQWILEISRISKYLWLDFETSQWLRFERENSRRWICLTIKKWWEILTRSQSLNVLGIGQKSIWK